MQHTTVLAGLRLVIVALVGMAATGITPAQQSSSFELSEHTFNAGGHPANGTVLTSGSFRLSLDALGNTVSGVATGSASFAVDVGFPASYRPPLEVQNLIFTDPVTLSWDPDGSVGTYALYRGQVPVFDPNYGSCLENDISGSTTTDGSTPGPGLAYFYLLTARNRLEEEGTKGMDSDNDERDNSFPCP